MDGLGEEEIIRLLCSPESNHYQRLGLPFQLEVDLTLLNTNHRVLSLKVHPDKCKHPLATMAMAELNNAKDCLSNKDNSRIYFIQRQHEEALKKSTDIHENNKRKRYEEQEEEDLREDFYYYEEEELHEKKKKEKTQPPHKKKKKKEQPSTSKPSDNPPKERYDWSPSQKSAIDSCLSGRNTFITGGGGVGKSEVVKRIIELLRDMGKVVGICSQTGMAAVPLGGATLHSMVGVGIPDGMDDDHLFNRFKKNKRNMKRWKDMDVLIVEEISMMDTLFFHRIDTLIRKVRKNNTLPFGGIQIITVGDFAQLPPIQSFSSVRDDKKNKKEVDDGNKKNKKKNFFSIDDDTIDDKVLDFCFELDLWKKLDFKVIQLDKVFRQKEDEFISLLNRIRLGDHTQKDLELLKSRHNVQLKEDDGIATTRLYPFKKSVKEENMEKLNSLPGQSTIYSSKYWWKHSNGTIYKEEEDGSGDDGSIKLDKVIRKKIIDMMKESCPVESNLSLKIGAQVVLVANLQFEDQLVNGSRGIVIGFENDHLPIVRFMNDKVITIHAFEWTYNVDRSITLYYSQIPLTLAWALTIHRCQGMSLDKAMVSMRGIFTYGQCYVALSRVKSFSGLSIVDFDEDVIKAHPKVIQFYRNNCQCKYVVDIDINRIIQRQIREKIIPGSNTSLMKGKIYQQGKYNNYKKKEGRKKKQGTIQKTMMHNNFSIQKPIYGIHTQNNNNNNNRTGSYSDSRHTSTPSIPDGKKEL